MVKNLFYYFYCCQQYEPEPIQPPLVVSVWFYCSSKGYGQPIKTATVQKVKHTEEGQKYE